MGGTLWSPGGHDSAEPRSMTRPRRDGGGKTLRHRLAEEEEKKSLIHSDKIWAPMDEENKKKKDSRPPTTWAPLCVLLCFLLSSSVVFFRVKSHRRLRKTVAPSILIDKHPGVISWLCLLSETLTNAQF